MLVVLCIAQMLKVMPFYTGFTLEDIGYQIAIGEPIKPSYAVLHRNS